MAFIIYLFIALIAVLLVLYLIKKAQLKTALKNIKEILAKHEEKVFIEEIKRTKNRNFLEKTNGKD